MPQLPYNTGKVLIGCRYTPPLPKYPASADEERIQRALIGGKRPSASPEYWAGLWVVILVLVLGLVMMVR